LTSIDPAETIKARRSEVEDALQAAYGADGWIAAAAREAVSAGGKRLRPVITLLVCEAISGSHNDALPVAVAYELAHSASLIQDDIIDESTLRHGEATAHKKYGISKAILLSDSLIFEIFTQLSKYADVQISKNNLAKILFYLGESARNAAEGELLEVSLSARGNVSQEEYLKIIALKTGALFASSAASGAVVAGADDELVERMHEFGSLLGSAFQMGDDILDIVGDTQATGKPALKDVQNNAGNIILVHALSKADPMQRNAISSLLYKKWFTKTEAERLRTVLRELGSLEYATKLVDEYAEKCRSILRTLPQSDARAALEAVTRTIETRKV
jgi:geranylgeranyl diphosphate synthase type I